MNNTSVLSSGRLNQIAIFLKRDTVSLQDYFKIAELITREHFASPLNASTALQRFVFVCKDINTCKVNALGAGASVSRVNTLTTLIANYFVKETSDIPSITTLVDEAIRTSNLSTSQLSTWILPKLLIVQNHLKSLDVIKDWFKSIDVPSVTMLASQYDEIGELRDATNQMFKELMQLRTYGVKPCAFEDGLFQSKNNYWVYMPASFFAVNPALNSNDTQMKTWVRLFEETLVSIVNVDSDKDLKTTDLSLGRVEMLGRAFRSYAAFGIGQNGELYLPDSPGIVGVKLPALRANLAPIYEVVRMNAIMRLYDLIVPLVIVNKEPSLPFVKRMLGLGRRIGSLDPQLILRRVRILFDSRPQVIEALEQEVEQSILETKPLEDKVKKTIPWFVRRLPKGYKASAEAKRLARQHLGRELKEGETFVREHTRNEGGQEQKMHTAKVKNRN